MPTSRNKRTPEVTTWSGPRDIPGRFVAILQGRNDDGDVVDILQENSDYIFVFNTTGTFINRPRRFKRAADTITNRTKRTPI